MPKYYFSLADGSAGDPELVELPNDEAARHEARNIARDLARNKTALGDQRIVAKTERGKVVCEVPLREPQ
jgi:hypothetical protein